MGFDRLLDVSKATFPAVERYVEFTPLLGRGSFWSFQVAVLQEPVGRMAKCSYLDPQCPNATHGTAMSDCRETARGWWCQGGLSGSAHVPVPLGTHPKPTNILPTRRPVLAKTKGNDGSRKIGVVTTSRLVAGPWSQDPGLAGITTLYGSTYLLRRRPWTLLAPT